MLFLWQLQILKPKLTKLALRAILQKNGLIGA